MKLTASASLHIYVKCELRIGKYVLLIKKNTKEISEIKFQYISN